MCRWQASYLFLVTNVKLVKQLAYDTNPRSKQLVEAYLAFPGLANIPSHLEFDKNALKGKINGIIERDWVALQLNELLIVEYYSRKG